MKTDAIIQGALTLESLLAAAVFEQTGKMREDALNLVPIERTTDHGFWLASSVFYGGKVTRDTTSIIRRRRRDETGPDFYAANTTVRKKSDPYAIEQSREDFKALMHEYPTVHAEKLAWFAQGDAEQCRLMLESLTFIGKRRGQGFGEISSVAVTTVDEHPLLDACGMVRRPIPVTQLHCISGAAAQDKQRLAYVATAHPFWLADATLCAIPPETDLRQITTKIQAAATDDDGFFE